LTSPCSRAEQDLALVNVLLSTQRSFGMSILLLLSIIASANLAGAFSFGGKRIPIQNSNAVQMASSSESANLWKAIPLALALFTTAPLVPTAGQSAFYCRGWKGGLTASI
jgi:hypothetical protein